MRQPITPAERLKYIRTQARLTRGHLEQKYGISAATLKAWENAVVPLSPKGLERCINAYREEGIAISSNWVMTGEGLPPQAAQQIGNYFREQQAEIREEPASYGTDDNTRMLQEASYFKETYPNSIIHMVTNDDMEPRYKVGDMVGGIFRYGDAIQETVRSVCIARLKTGQDLLRYLYQGETSACYNLAAINPEPTTSNPVLYNIELEAAAPVIWHRIPEKK